MNTITAICFPALLMLFSVAEAYNISCYSCDSTETMTCGETLADGHGIEPIQCDQLQDPQYCIKMTGIFEVSSISCYECSAVRGDFCPTSLEKIHHDAGFTAMMKSNSCDYVIGAKYCIKATGMFEGFLGTKRFCSARDFGNYCEMVERPGDERLYRACIFTCSTNYCNSSFAITSSLWTVLLSVFFSYKCMS